MTMRIAGLFLTALGALAATGEMRGLALPTARWFFEISRDVPWLNVHLANERIFPWFGWLSTALLIACGLLLVLCSWLGGPRNPVTEQRIRRFRAIKRGYFSLVILLFLGGLAALDQVVVGKRALAVKYEGEWSFPAFQPGTVKNADYGMRGESAEAPADFRELKRRLEADGSGRVILPLIPYDPTGDTLPARSRALEQRDGLYYEDGDSQPFSGMAATYHNVEKSLIHLRYSMRHGLRSGPVDGYDPDGSAVYSGDYKYGSLVRDRYSGGGAKAKFLAFTGSELRAVKYHPAPPLPEAGNWLGTTSQGYDVLAYLYGGMQVNFKAALIYLPIIYLIGISVGMMMGFFGGWFDLIVQRLIEVLSNMPFLFVVIIFSSVVPERYKGLPVILTILIAFGWMGMTFLMRSAAYRDRERDYIAAARVLGAGTPRILFLHLLPNTVAILVTLVPFTLSGLIFALTSLDYLGFGLPPEYATWGRLLNDGLANLSAPWLVTSTFIVLVGMLVLITFVGEAVREAVDPKKFTYYR
ncbi:MAG: ABC transporter permease subunit [Verrucomicrobia bacterium]|nr:MAG: ABC transporter permease subunit [Verrucomicrobiota bacterium]